MLFNLTQRLFQGLGAVCGILVGHNLSFLVWIFGEVAKGSMAHPLPQAPTPNPNNGLEDGMFGIFM